jgi:hypothetical protein
MTEIVEDAERMRTCFHATTPGPDPAYLRDPENSLLHRDAVDSLDQVHCKQLGLPACMNEHEYFPSLLTQYSNQKCCLHLRLA